MRSPVLSVPHDEAYRRCGDRSTLPITQHKGLIAEEVVAWGYYPFRPVLAGSLCAWHDGIISRRKATLALGPIDVAPCLSGGVGPDQLEDCET